MTLARPPTSILPLKLCGVNLKMYFGAELTRDRSVTEDAGGTLHAFDELGYAVAFTRSSALRAVLDLPDTNTVGRAIRRDQRAPGTIPHRVVQQRMIHVVPWVPRKQREMFDFYVGRLGFRVTESVAGAGAFLRTPLSHDHHNLFLQTRGDNHGFQHVAFEVRDVDDVMLCGRSMEDRGWRSHIGPGRHVAGSNVYWYFHCPAGGLVEVGADMDYITDHWTALEHATIPHGGSSWYVRPEDAGRRPGWGDWPQFRERSTVGE